MTRWMGLIFWTLVCVPWAAAAPSFSADTTASIARLQSLLVGHYGEEEGMEGTAILVDAERGLVLTNLHNLLICREHLRMRASLSNGSMVGKVCPAKTMMLDFSQAKGSPQTSGAEILAHGSILTDGPHDDWALLRVNCPSCRSIPVLNVAKELPKNGDAVVMVGYPGRRSVGEKIEGGKDGLRLSRGRYLTQDEAIASWNRIYSNLRLPEALFSGLWAFAKRKFFETSQQVFHTAPTTYGYSGSPILNERDELVGMAWGITAVWFKNAGKRPKDLRLNSDRETSANTMGAAVELPTRLPTILAPFVPHPETQPEPPATPEPSAVPVPPGGQEPSTGSSGSAVQGQ